jgi:carboxyl-terminal processing protease
MAETPLRTDALMSRRTRLLVLLVSTPLVAFAIIGGLLGKAAGREDTYQHLRVFEDVVSLVESNYVEAVDMDQVMEGAMRGLADGLDADTSYLTPAEVRVVESGAPVPEGDTGVEFTRQYYLRVVAVRDGTPAARAGVRTGDYVRAIDGRPTRDMSVFEGGRLMHGPVGSKVKLTVIRGNAAEPHEIELVREKVTALAVTARMAAPGVGLVRIAALPEGVATDVQREVLALQRDGATHLLVDLRGTATGQFDAGLATARLFVPTGTLAQRESRGAAGAQMVTAGGQAPFSLPVTLLTTAGTSGAAELLVAALVGNRRADQVGERTLGRASEQKLVKLPDGSGLWLTTVRYLTPEGKAILGSGLEPTEAVEEPDIEFGIEPQAGDPILEKALARATLKKAA